MLISERIAAECSSDIDQLEKEVERLSINTQWGDDPHSINYAEFKDESFIEWNHKLEISCG